MYPIICKKKSKKIKSKIYPPVCFAPVRFDDVLPSKIIPSQMHLVGEREFEEEDAILDQGRVYQAYPFCSPINSHNIEHNKQNPENIDSAQAQPKPNRVSSTKADVFRTGSIFFKEPIEEFSEDEKPMKSKVNSQKCLESISEVLDPDNLPNASSDQIQKKSTNEHKVQHPDNTKDPMNFISQEIKIPSRNYTKPTAGERGVSIPMEASQPIFQSSCLNQTPVLYPYLKPATKYISNEAPVTSSGPVMTYDIHSCMQTTQLKLIHENIKLSKENELLKRNADVDQKIIKMLRSNIQTLNYIVSKKPYQQLQQCYSDLQLFQNPEDYGQ